MVCYTSVPSLRNFTTYNYHNNNLLSEAICYFQICNVAESEVAVSDTCTKTYCHRHYS